MDELTIGDKIYISSKQAAKITGYAKDYVGQLCREGRVEARLVGRNWYVLESSIREHRFGAAPVAVEAAPEPVEKPVTSPVSSWEPVTYAPVQEESPLPPLQTLQSPAEKADTTEAVALMQDAWKEWFAARAEVEAVAEEGSVVSPEKEEEVSAEPEASTTEEVRASDIPNVYNTFEVSHQEEVAEEVPLSRMPQEEVRVEHQEYRPAPTAHVLDVSQMRPQARESVVDLSPAWEVAYEPTIAPRRVPQRRKRTARSPLSIQALFIAVAGLAVVIAVIGSGIIDHLLIEQGIRDGFRGAIFEAIRGETRLEK